MKDQQISLEGDGSLDLVIENSDGDARRLINIIEQLANTSGKALSKADVTKTLQKKLSSFDKGGDIFYQQLSAFHKSVRGSSPDGALYWMARMIVSGCDPKVIARRLLAIASEDIGNADPRALQICVNAWDVYERLGDKEGNRAIAQAAVFCACAPKSNSVYKAFNSAIEAAKESNDLEVPIHLRNAPTKLLEELDHGKGYRYAHDEPGAISKGQTYFPDEMGEKIYYEPTDRGLEIKIKEKLDQLRSAYEYIIVHCKYWSWSHRWGFKSILYWNNFSTVSWKRTALWNPNLKRYWFIYCRRFNCFGVRKTSSE
jgi:putative ATPase